MGEESRDASVSIPTIPLASNEKVLSSILELTDYADRISYGGGSAVRER